MSRRALVIGGGIVGLTTALALRQVGWEPVVFEQAAEVRAAGAAFGLWRNALRVFKRLGILDRLQRIGRPAEMYFHDPTGQLLTTPSYGPDDHAYLLVNRAELTDLLADAFGRGGIQLNARLVAYAEAATGVQARFSDGRVETGDVLVGADGIFSAVRAQLLPDAAAVEHVGHVAWRAVVPGYGARVASDAMVVGYARCRGGSARTHDGGAFWLVSQFGSTAVNGSPKAEALARAARLTDGGWNAELLELIAATPEERILQNQVMLVPPIDTWVSARVALAGDAAHGMSPHITAGASLGVEDALWLAHCLQANDDAGAALRAYESNRLAHYREVQVLSKAVEDASTPLEFAQRYAAFSHWMMTQPAPPGVPAE